MRSSRAAVVPDEIRAALEQLFGESVAHVRVIEYSWLARLHGRALATTRRERIYLRGGADAFFADPRLVLHEYWHVIGQWRRGTLTVPRYLLECLRRGYWNNRFEVEARAFAATHSGALRSLIAQPLAAARPGPQAASAPSAPQER
ncbi:MAG TPA: DUF4157 domain-containing protein [Steroidobacteraceae bacterium]|nr:DUF4157 domain-containing protein [Steroidobacteraceae bacterium]